MPAVLLVLLADMGVNVALVSGLIIAARIAIFCNHFFRKTI